MTELDLLVVGGLTLDRIGGTLRPGGAVLFAAEAAAAAGWRVGVLTTAGGEDEAADGLRRLRRAAAVVECLRGPGTTSFSHELSGGTRRLALEVRGSHIPELGAAVDWRPRAVLLAPVAGEVAPRIGVEVTARAPEVVVAAAIQGWLRVLHVGQGAAPLALEHIGADVTAAVRELNVVLASTEDLDMDPRRGVSGLRAWLGAGPEIVVTAGTAGVLVDDGVTRHVPVLRRVPAADTTGVGDAFAALLTARRGAGEQLEEAARGAAAGVVEFLELRGGGRGGNPRG